MAARGNRRLAAEGASAKPDTIVGGTKYAIIRLQPGWSQIATPFAFTTLIFRVLQNLWEDWCAYRTGGDFRIRTSVFGD